MNLAGQSSYILFGQSIVRAAALVARRKSHRRPPGHAEPAPLSLPGQTGRLTMQYVPRRYKVQLPPRVLAQDARVQEPPGANVVGYDTL